MNNTYTIDELIALLQEIRDQHHGGVSTNIDVVSAQWQATGHGQVLKTILTPEHHE